MTNETAIEKICGGYKLTHNEETYIVPTWRDVMWYLDKWNKEDKP